MSPTEELVRCLGTLDVPLDLSKTATFSAAPASAPCHLMAVVAPEMAAAMDEGESEFSTEDFRAVLQRVSRRKTLIELADEGMQSIHDHGGVDLDDLKKDLGL